MNTRDRGRKLVAQVCTAWRCPDVEGATNPWRRHFQPKLGVPCALPARTEGLCIVGVVSEREGVARDEGICSFAPCDFNLYLILGALGLFYFSHNILLPPPDSAKQASS